MKNQTSNVKDNKSKKKDRVAEAAGTLEWLITAFILAFVFRAFAVEAFRIPTGSMADTLMGAHYQLRCTQCGYEFEFGYMEGQDEVSVQRMLQGPMTRCPNCGFGTNPFTEAAPVCSGDRILVLKCIYQFMNPKRWDVVVFKNPTRPSENYIKRLIGLPGEQVQIIDGDVYINDQIARKPPEVQKELWMPVCDFDYQPVNPNQLQAFNGNKWTPPFNFGASAWKQSTDDPTQIVLDCPAEQVSTLTYGSPSASDFRVIHAYNPLYATLVKQAPQCSDMMMRFYVTPKGAAGKIGITLNKYGVDYKAWWDLAGKLTIARVENGQETVLKEGSGIRNQGSGITSLTPAPRPLKPVLMKFAVVDHQLLFEFDGTKLQVDLGRSLTALTRTNTLPRVDIFGAGSMTLSHIAIFRDTYYTSTDPSTAKPLRATEGTGPFQLNKDQFFMLGDNSPMSADSRFWTKPTLATKGTEPPRAGVVPHYYLLGKAIFVYWPGGFSPFPPSVADRVPGAGLRWIPNIGKMRFIYGSQPATDCEKRDNGIGE
jgi:signal peptidase I